MLLTMNDFNKIKYDPNLKSGTTVICFKFKANEKSASVTPLQSDVYPNASSNLDDQLFFK